MIDHGSLTGAIGAYLTGVAVTSAPWLLTTTVLMSLRVLARHQGATAFRSIEHMLTIIYALTVVLSAPVHVVVSRYTADRLYDRRLEQHPGAAAARAGGDAGRLRDRRRGDDAGASSAAGWSRPRARW